MHRQILDIYNSHEPLARNYRVQVRDAYCATTVSAAWIKAGIADYTGTECSVQKLVEIAQRKGIWIEDDSYMPKAGDACVYDWQDSGIGDDRGSGDHIGIATQIMSNSFVVTEGNMSGGRVGTRTVMRNGKFIRGFIAPDYEKIAGGGDRPEVRYKYLEDIPKDYREIIEILVEAKVINGYGDGILDLSEDMCRDIVYQYRGGGFDRKLIKMGMQPAVDI